MVITILFMIKYYCNRFQKYLRILFNILYLGFGTVPVGPIEFAQNIRVKNPGVVNLCSLCSYSTSDSGNFKRHLLIHSGERPFKCGVCGRNFSQKTHLKRHTLVHINASSMQ